MAIYRTIQMSFWTDAKVTDDLTPQDKFFYLYLLTNPHTNLCGCYELSLKQAADETGYNRDTIERLMERFDKQHGIAMYSNETKEVLITKWAKYNWTQSDKFRKALKSEIDSVKCDGFRDYLVGIFESKDPKMIRYRYPSDTTVTVTVTVTDTDTVSDTVTVIDSDTKDETKNDNREDTKDDTKDNEKALEDFFESLWMLFPKKRVKHKVSKKSKQAIMKVGYDEMVRAIERYKSETEGKDQQYVMHGSTFFNGGYIDYLDENYEPLAPTVSRTTQEFTSDIARMASWAERRKANDGRGFCQDSGGNQNLLSQRENHAG